jgi:NAD(P)-dependent dehydrogenase (short-subunit alcohol dehydrogenase family)
MKFTVDATPSLKGKVALVTGGNIGLGYETVKAIASRGAHVVLAARNEEKGRKAVETIIKENPNFSVEFLQLDLASQASIKKAVEEFNNRHKVLDILVNNAGIMAMPEMKTQDGYESQFGVNHLGHWSLTALLIPSILRSNSARIVTVTSSAHHLIGRIKFDDPHLRKKYSPWTAYSQSKLANYYFALGLHNEFEKRGLNIKSMLAHPGLSHTNLQVETYAKGASGLAGSISKSLAASIGMEPRVGALPQIRAALDPKAKSRQFYAPRYLAIGAPVTRPFLRPLANRAIKKLWALSARETGLKIEI